VSAVELSGFKNLRKSIQNSKISTNFKEIPLSVYVSLTNIKQKSDQLIWRENIIEPYILEFFHKIGEIVYFPKSGLVCAKPVVLAKLMGLFICPDIHELTLLNYVEKLK